jgi:prolyl oligopeptidase
MVFIRAFFLVILAIILLSCQELELDTSRKASAQAAERLHQLFQDEWERYLRENPVFASSLGDRRYDDEWGDNSLEAIRASYKGDKKALERLHSISRVVLSESERLNYDLFERQLKTDIEGFQYRAFLMPLDQLGGVQNLHEVAERLRLQTEKDFHDWIMRLNQINRVVEETMELMKVGLKEGRTQPKIIMKRIPAQIARQIVNKPKESPFYQVFKEMPESISATIQAELRKQAEQAIANVVIPTYRRFQVFFNQQYLPNCRESIGAYALPEGKAFYAYQTLRFTTTELTPEEIHQIGLKEVARIRNEMEEIIKQLRFGGSFNEFLRFLRTDPQFYYQDPGALIKGYRAIAKKIDPELVKLFGKLPRMPYGIKPIPMSSAPDTATGYYQQPAADGSRAGYYYVNLYKPEVRPKYEMEVLTLHEAVPGHHLQIALQQELRDLPNFRRFSGFTAFEEGWGLYAESLGEKLGLYQDLYSKFGQLTYEMWRAIRLVVDTGIHFKGWTRQQAIEFFKENAAKTEHDIVNEIDRYIAWPGQALAYKIGELKIKALRELASVNLGNNFSIRAFHDMLLSNGALPLDILEHNVNEWIRAQQEASGALVTRREGEGG